MEEKIRLATRLKEGLKEKISALNLCGVTGVELSIANRAYLNSIDQLNTLYEQAANIPTAILPTAVNTQRELIHDRINTRPVTNMNDTLLFGTPDNIVYSRNSNRPNVLINQSSSSNINNEASLDCDDD